MFKWAVVDRGRARLHGDGWPHEIPGRVDMHYVTVLLPLLPETAVDSRSASAAKASSRRHPDLSTHCTVVNIALATYQLHLSVSRRTIRTLVRRRVSISDAGRQTEYFERDDYSSHC